ncbi:unnamed protein product, partial [Acidithrix sp. C25]
VLRLSDLHEGNWTRWDWFNSDDPISKSNFNLINQELRGNRQIVNQNANATGG